MLVLCADRPHDSARYSRSLMPKHEAHSSRAMYLSLSASHSSKKRVVQCSMGMSGARRGESSEWVRYLRAERTRTWGQSSCGKTVPVAASSTLKADLVLVISWKTRTHQRGAGPAGQTASGRGRCTCCSSSRSHEPAGPESDRQPGASSRSRRSSSPERIRRRPDRECE